MSRIRVKYSDDETKHLEDLDLRINDRIGVLMSEARELCIDVPYGVIFNDPFIKDCIRMKTNIINRSSPTYIIEKDN